MKRLMSILAALGVTGAAASAQFVEPDVDVLLERSIGPAGNDFGGEVLALNDVNGDGVADLAASDSGTQSAGRVHVLSGVDGSTLWTRSQPGSLQLGSALERMDWNADGVLDVVAGAPSPFTVPGRTWIFSGVDGTVLADLSPSFDRFGQILASGGDLDGNGTEDLLVGTPEEAVFLTGRVDVYERGSTAPFRTLLGQYEFDFFGSAIAFVGDTDVPPDGRDEIAVGIGGYLAPSGQVRVYGWQGSGPSERFTIDLAEAARDLDGGKDVNGDGLPDFAAATKDGVLVFSGGDGALLHTLGQPDAFGAVALLDDLDGDSRADIAAGSRTSSSGANLGGKVFLYSGASGALVKTITSTTANRFLGADVREIDDLDGDGKHDLVVGAEGAGSSHPIGSVLVFSLSDDPCFTLDFESEDDFATPLVNGQHIDSEFGNLVAPSSSGPNAGLAIFDSTTGGPNDPSQDPDLLVDSGNILILQTENFPPDANDIFPRPNDDQDGGTITFDCLFAVEPRSLRLVDIDSGDGTSSVVLTDGSGRRRTYTVPSNWTGDRTLAQPGQGTLGLATLDPQPGFGSIATASEAAGFDASDVLRLDVHLGGSGGIDDVSACLSNQPRAAVTLRNGSGVNPRILTPATPPVLGRTWSANLDCRALGNGLALLAVRRSPTAGVMSPFGEVLIGGHLLHRTVRPYSGSPSSLAWNIPFDMSLCGLELHAQGLCQESGASSSGSRLSLLRARLSNALDLVVGF